MESVDFACGYKPSSFRYDMYRPGLSSLHHTHFTSHAHTHMHTHTHTHILWFWARNPKFFLFFIMADVWAVSKSHHAERFLIRGTWDWGTVSLPPSLLSSRWVWLLQRRLERGRDMNIFMADNAYFWHIALRFSDTTDKTEEERKDLPQNWAVNEEPDSVCSLSHTHTHTHTASKTYPAHIRTQVELFINFLMGKESQENSMLHSGPILLSEQHSEKCEFLNFKWEEEFEL